MHAHLTETTPETRPAWARPDWFAEAAEWTVRELANRGYPLLGRVEQHSSWAISSLLTVPTEQGLVYFKASSTHERHGNESQLLTWLADRFPDDVPTPIAIDGERRWMLLPDLGDPLGTKAPVDTLLQMVRRFGTLQRRAADHPDELVSAGCTDNRLERVGSISSQNAHPAGRPRAGRGLAILQLKLRARRSAPGWVTCPGNMYQVLSGAPQKLHTVHPFRQDRFRRRRPIA